MQADVCNGTPLHQNSTFLSQNGLKKESWVEFFIFNQHESQDLCPLQFHPDHTTPQYHLANHLLW